MGMGAAASAGKGGPGKEEEAWKRSEAALKKKEQSVRNALKEKQRTLQQVCRSFYSSLVLCPEWALPACPCTGVSRV